MLPPFLQEIRVAARSRYDLGHGVWREVNALILSWLYDRLRRFGFSEWPNHRKIKKPLCVGLRVPCHSPQLRKPSTHDSHWQIALRTSMKSRYQRGKLLLFDVLKLINKNDDSRCCTACS